MQLNDLVIISVDDHICEPPGLFVTADITRPVTSGDILRMFAERVDPSPRT
jgi:hypothetical protein